MIDSVTALVSAHVAVGNAIIATDGAQISTDVKEAAADGALAGFGEILQKMSEVMCVQPQAKAPAQSAVEVVDALTLLEVNPASEAVAAPALAAPAEVEPNLAAQEADATIEPKREEKRAEAV